VLTGDAIEIARRILAGFAQVASISTSSRKRRSGPKFPAEP